MRIGGPPVSDSRSPINMNSAGMGADPRPGETLRVRVLSGGDGTAKLRTQDGAVLRVRLEEGVALPPGSEIELQVTGCRDGVLYMALSPDAAAGSGPPDAAAVPADALSEAILSALESMGLPPSAGTLESAKQLLLEYPDAEVRTAVFLAANGIPAGEASLRAADGLLSGGAGVADMLRELAEAVELEEGLEFDGRPAVVPQLEAGAEPGSVAEPVVVPWVEFLRVAVGMGAARESPAVPGVVPAAVREAFAEEAVVPDSAVAEWETAVPEQVERNIEIVPAEREAEAGGPSADGAAFPREGETVEGAVRDLAGAILPVLARLPAFQGVPARTAAALAQTLAAVSGQHLELGDADGVPAKVRLRALIEGLFARVDAEEGGAELRRAAEELLVRLALFREALGGAGVPARSPAARLAERLLDHARLLDGVEQYAYLQLPILLRGEQREAELFVYREKRGSKRIDPENIRILLALDLEHMGHFEAFINIRGRDVSLEMDVGSAGAEGMLRQNTARLHRLLDEAGFHLADTKVRVRAGERTSAGNALLTLLNREKRHGTGLDYLI